MEMVMPAKWRVNALADTSITRNNSADRIGTPCRSRGWGVVLRTFHLVLYAGLTLSCRLPWPGLLLLLRAAVRFRRGVSQLLAGEGRDQREGGKYRGGGDGRPGRG